MNQPIRKPIFYFHLGLPKVASTYLQTSVFPRLPGIHVAHRRKFNAFKDSAYCNQFDKLLFSCEFHTGTKEQLEAVFKVHPHARIIMVFRRHASWLESKYRYYIRKHGYLTFKEYFRIEDDGGVLKINEVYYRPLIEQITGTFSQKPLLLNYDDLRKDSGIFLKKLFDYLETPLNPQEVSQKVVKKAFSDKQIYVLRRFNRIYRYHELKTGFRLINKIHYKYREFLLHTVAFFAKYLPFSMKKKEPIIDREYLRKIDDFFEADWNYFLKHAD